MKESLISVVVPTYNIEAYIGQCLESILSQSYQNLEIIVVDDCSTDHTLEIIKNYATKDFRVHVYVQPHCFAGSARNNGLRRAKGEYIMFLDGDDYYASEMIEQMLYSSITWRSDIVICNATYLDDETGEMTDPTFYFSKKITENNNFISRETCPRDILSFGNVVPWNKLFRTDFLKVNELEFQTTRRNNDEYFVSVAKVLAKRISWVDERYVIHRINNKNSLQGYGDASINYDLYYAYIKIRETLIKKGVYEEIKPFFFDKIVSGCINILCRMPTYHSYREMYNKVIKRIFEEFGLYDIDENLINGYKNEFSCIKNMSAENYLFYVLYRGNKINKQHLVPFSLLGTSTKIAIYGAGTIGQSYYAQLINNSHYIVTNWYDRDYYKLKNKRIENPAHIQTGDFEKIIIAIDNDKIVDDVTRTLINYGISEENIIRKPHANS